MNCDAAQDLIIDGLLDGTDPELQGALEEHLAGCESCRAERDQMSGLWRALGRLPAPSVSADAAVRFGARLGRSGGWLSRRTVQVAAAAVLLFVGFGAGWMMPDLASDGAAAAAGVEQRAFLLLIRGDEPDRRAPSEQLVREYGGWAEKLENTGVLVNAEKLVDGSGRWVSQEPTPAEVARRSPVTGYFVIRAADYEEAVRVAMGSPHITYGGLIEVRAIERF